jgi:hypothetical protein
VFFEDDDVVVERAEGVGDSWIFLVYQELAAVLELELVGEVGLQRQIDDAASMVIYFSSMPLSGLKVFVMSFSDDHSSQLPITFRWSRGKLEDMRTGRPWCFST